MAIHRIELQGEDSLVLALPSGQEVTINLSDIEDDALPELEILFDCEMTANCYLDGMEPAVQWKDNPHVFTFRDIIIPVERSITGCRRQGTDAETL